jgi:hypothetical protein
MIQIKIKVSNEEQTLTEKYQEHEEGLRLAKDDPKLSEMVNRTMNKFTGVVDRVQIKAEFEW